MSTLCPATALRRQAAGSLTMRATQRRNRFRRAVTVDRQPGCETLLQKGRGTLQAHLKDLLRLPYRRWHTAAPGRASWTKVAVMNLIPMTRSRTIELAARARRLPHWALAIGLTLALVLVGQLGALPVIVILRALYPGGSESVADQPLPGSVAMAALLVSTFGLMLVLLWAWLRWFERRPFWTLGFERAGALRKYARGFAIGLLAFGASVAILGTSGLTSLDHVEGAAVGGILIVLVGWIVQGASEEILTRGWLLNVIAARYRPWLGVLTSVIVFSLLHGLNPNIGPLPLLNLVLFALFAGLYMLWEDGLWGIAAFHSAWNWAQGNLFGMQVSGNEAGATLLQMKVAAGADLMTGGGFGPEGGLAVTIVMLAALGLVGFALARKHAARSQA